MVAGKLERRRLVKEGVVGSPCAVAFEGAVHTSTAEVASDWVVLRDHTQPNFAEEAD